MQASQRAHGWLFLATVSGSLNYLVAGELMREYLDPSLVILSRMGVAALFFFMMDFALNGKTFEIEGRSILWVFLCGVLGVFLNQNLFYRGLPHTTPAHAAMIMAIIPVQVFLFSVFRLHERIAWLRWLGLALSTAATWILLNMRENGGTLQPTLFGDLMILGNASAYAAYMVIVKPLALQHRPLYLLKWIFLTGFILSVPFNTEAFDTARLWAMPAQGWAQLTFVWVFATLFNYWVSVDSMRYLLPSAAGAYIYVQPVLTTLLSIALGWEWFGWEKGLVMAAILFGVWLVTFRQGDKR
jgi:drug/metabolite transporter (DMT)-like permease